jgi:hypothetical protein
MFSVDIFYPPQSPLTKGGSSVLPLTKGELEGVSQRTLNTYALRAATQQIQSVLNALAKRYSMGGKAIAHILTTLFLID